MISPLPLPDWVPPWAQLAVLVVILLFGLMFLLMPFAVFGVKGRLELIEARLDEIQGEIRSLSLRLPEPGHDDEAMMSGRQRFTDLDSYTGLGDAGHYGEPASYGGQRPPIPPPSRDRGRPSAPPRTEPRLY